MHIHIFTWQGQRDGTNELAGFQPGAQVTTDRLIKDLPNYDAVFHIGDLSYANGFLAQWDQFTAQIEPSLRGCRTWWQGCSIDLS
jgi:hypothetical protein